MPIYLIPPLFTLANIEGSLSGSELIDDRKILKDGLQGDLTLLLGLFRWELNILKKVM